LTDGEKSGHLRKDASSIRSIDTPNPVLSPPAGVSGNLAAHLVIALITGIPQVIPGQLQGINLLDPSHHLLIRQETHPDCPDCRRVNG
jgi:hypothetical protein